MLLPLLIWASLGAHAEPRPIFRRAAALLEDRYLWPDRIDARGAFVAAAEEAEQAIPWLIVTPTDAGYYEGRPNRGREEVGFVVGDDARVWMTGRWAWTLGCDRGLPWTAAPGRRHRNQSTQGVARSLDKHTVVMASPA